MVNVFLPDFVGHPFCFNGFISDKNHKSIYIDYSEFAGYSSITDLAERIFYDLKKVLEVEEKVNLIGFSFGGLIAFELSVLLNTLNLDNTVYLIDSHLRLSKKQSVHIELKDIFNDYPNLSYLKDLIFLGEIKEDIVNLNLELFESYCPEKRINKAYLFIASHLFRTDVSCKKWKNYIDEVSIHKVSCDHWNILHVSEVRYSINNLLRGIEC